MAWSPFALFINACLRFSCHFLSAIAWHWLVFSVGECCAATCELQASPLPRARVESSTLTSDWKKFICFTSIWTMKGESECSWKHSKKVSWRMDIWVMAAEWSRPRRIWHSGFKSGTLCFIYCHLDQLVRAEMQLLHSQCSHTVWELYWDYPVFKCRLFLGGAQLDWHSGKSEQGGIWGGGGCHWVLPF